MKKLVKKTVLLFLLIIILIWLVGIVKCEIFTMLYSNDFKGKTVEDVNLGNSLKILNYSYEYAEVYYRGDLSYYLVTFYKADGKWLDASFRIVRNEKDKYTKIFIWPYFWDYFM